MAALDALVQAIRDADVDGSGAARADVLTHHDLTVLEVASHPSFTDDASAPLTIGVPASPGAASGEIVLSADAALNAADAGRRVVLVRPETTPDDVLGMQVSAGILTARGGIVSHAAVVARGWGLPAVVGAAELVIDDTGISVGGVRLTAGDVISIDGTTGEVHLGARTVHQSSLPHEIETLLGWADRVNDGAITVRANADTDTDARHALHMGARGIGLCRTEHMFLAPDRLPLIRRFIMSDDGSTEAQEALDLLEQVQRVDFESILRVMRDLPVTVRLLDPPLHEFLPPLEPLTTAQARGELDDEGLRMLAALRRLHETNPMIGTRGVRLGVVRQGLYQMQVRALARAVATMFDEGIRPKVEVMIPLVIGPEELAAARNWVGDALHEVGGTKDAVSIGVMIETPRAALLAGSLAQHADFFSFGTNDLTQLTFAFSRDDVEAHLLPAYLASGLLPANPFATIDPDGVGRLLRLACTEARESRPHIRLGVCGEQAGDPASIELLLDAGVEALSCSPFRIPMARLAAARALLLSGRVDASVLDAQRVDTANGDTARATTSFVGKPTADLVLHVLRVRGFVTIDGVAESIMCDPADAAPLMSELVTRGLARHIESRDLYQLTPSGHERHAHVLTTMRAESRHDVMAAGYGNFLALNHELKQLCTDWQTRNGAPNDHSDHQYDMACIDRLGNLLDTTEPVVQSFAEVLPRFTGYAHRLRAAHSQVRSGDVRMFTGVMCGSFHDVWMELHEDLVQLLGVDRVAEGSF